MNYKDIINSKYSEPAMIFSYKDGQVKVLDINEHYLAELQMNINPQEFIDADFLACFDEANRVIWTSALNNCIASKAEAESETKRTLLSSCCGTSVVRIRGRLVFVEERDGAMIIYEGIRNITAERNSLEEMIENERRVKIAIEQINIYYWEYTIATKEMRPCFRCMRDLGLPALVKNYPEPAIELGIFPPDYADMYRDWHRQLAAGVPELEAVIPLTVGRVPFRVKYTLETDEKGNPYKAYGSATLISEAELKRAKLDSSIIETLADEYNGIYLADLNANTVKVLKQEANSVMEFDENYSFTANLHRIIPAFREQYSGSFEQFSNMDFIRKEFFKTSDRREFNFRHRDAGKWIRANFRVVEYDADDNVIKILFSYSVIDDYRAQKMDADILIAEQKAQLEEKQAQLIDAVESANRANRAKSDFLARMSHEIRTPMNAIMGMNEIILKRTVDADIKGYADDAYKAATSLLGTINEILDFSKIESGKMELVEDDYKYGPFIGNIYTMFAMRAEDKNLALIFNVDENIPAVLKGDELRIRQILTNLLSNAVKYTDRGTITFTATCMGRDGEQALIKYEIKDTGRGIKEEDMSRLFAEFERIDEKHSKNIEGTGLGMTIVSRLLDMMGSKLEVKSVYGEGSEFSFTISQAIRSTEALGNFREALEADSTADEAVVYVNPDARILLVDDNIVNLRVITALLQESKVKVVSVTSGEQAIRASSCKKFDLIFMDHYMPEMDGIEAMKHIKNDSDSLNRETPVVVLTANAIKGAEAEYLADGFADVVYKPTTQKELCASLSKLLPV